MADLFTANGAVKTPSRFAGVSMGGTQFTGLVTQRSPYSCFTEYLVRKFYGGSRIDAIADGTNREISVALTDRRAPGSAVYNSNAFPPALSLGSWKYNQNGSEVVRVLLDGTDGKVYDATAGQKSTLLTKATGAGAAQVLGVNTELFIGDGVEQKKVLRSAKTWSAKTVCNIGDFIIDANGNIQSVQTNPVSYTITNVAVVEIEAQGYYVLTFTGAAPVMNSNQTCSFSGLTTYTALNGQTIPAGGINASVLSQLALTANQLALVPITGWSPYAPAADTGTMVAHVLLPGTSGATLPTFSSTWGVVTNDGGLNGGVNWTCFGSSTQNWGITPVPFAAPSYQGPVEVASSFFATYWGMPLDLPFASSPNTVTFAILDANGNVQVTTFTYEGFGPSRLGGLVYPIWSANAGQTTIDNLGLPIGPITWTNYGQIATWYTTTNYGGATSSIPNPCCVTDTNGNLQITNSLTVAQQSGASAPTWATSGTTSDGAITWTYIGAGAVQWSGQIQYAYSLHSIDGTVSTASPVTLIANGGLGLAGAFQLNLKIPLAGTAAVTDKQVDQIWLWRTVQGYSTLIQLDTIPNPYLTGSPTAYYTDVLTDLQLNAFISAPVAESADPPPLGFLPCCYALQRIWGIVGNTVVYSQGPDAVTGNGLTQFAPLNEIPFIGKPWSIFPITVQDGGQVVFTSSGIWIILGSGTATDPFYARPYFQSVNVAGPNAVTLFNQTFFVIEATNKVSAVAVQFPFQPSTGYTEIGLSIGDQFQKVTTGGINAALFNPATAFISWNSQNTKENALYVADGAGHWFRLSAVSPPESGLMWHPIRTLLCGSSAVQAVETAPGVTQLLIAPASGTGPLLVRDATGTVWTDPVAGTPTGYPSWDAKGPNLLCSTGEWAEVSHIAAKSRAVGARPVVSVLLNEIAPVSGTGASYTALTQMVQEPARGRKSVSVFSDRYNLLQNGVDTLGDSLLVKFDYGAQTVGDELLDWGINASVTADEEEQVNKA